MDEWRNIGTAPKDGTPFLAWCPIIHGLGDNDATPEAEMRIVWWESRGQFTSDRDLGNEVFTHWMPLPAEPFKFKETFCSNCGGKFGPGNHGFSHCENHREMMRIE